MRSSALLESAWQDFVYAGRTFLLNKGFFAIAVISLSLGIGANTAIFQLLNAVRLRVLPVPRADQLVQVQKVKNEHCCSGNSSDRHPDFTFPQWEQIRDQQQAFSSVFAFGDEEFNLAKAGDVRMAKTLFITGEFFKTLEIHPALGRLIEAADDHAGCGAQAADISYGFWQKEYGGAKDVLSKTVSLDGHSFEIAGVTPASFFGVEVGKNVDVFVPACSEPVLNGAFSHTEKRDHWWLAIIGRLKPGWTPEKAAAQMQAISAGVFQNTVPPMYRTEQAKWYTQYKLTATPAGGGVSSLRETYSQPLELLLGIAGLVLLIACANLANLMLARASAREREMAVRMAIGANRTRLVRQLLMESFALTVCGTVAGALMAQFLTAYLVSFLSTTDNPLFLDLTLDWRVLGFTALLAVVTCFAFGLTPALRVTRTDPASAMKATSRNVTADRGKFGMRKVLVVSQVALSLVLVVGALLFVRSLHNLLTLDAGFRRTGLLVISMESSRLQATDAQKEEIYRQLLDHLRHAPGVEDAARTFVVPISGSGWRTDITLAGQTPDRQRRSWFNRVSDGYFRTMGTRLIAGRDFNDHDTAASSQVAIVNQAFCRRYIGHANPIGVQFETVPGRGEKAHQYEIVGVVQDAKYRDMREAFEPEAFLVSAQYDPDDFNGTSFVVRSSMALGALLPELRQTILHTNGNLSFDFEGFQKEVEDSLMRERLMARLSGFFGFLAAVLATVGLYGVISYMVARRRSEIGIRMALGADRSGIVALVLKEALLLLGTGLVVGCLLTFVSVRAASTELYGLNANDPATIVAAVGGLIVIALLASAVPAWRASQVEPIQALRQE